MEISLDRDKLFEQFLAGCDLRTNFRSDGEHFSGPKDHLKRGFDKTLDQIQDLLEDAYEARQILLDFGFGDASSPLKMLVNDLVARVVESTTEPEVEIPIDDEPLASEQYSTDEVFMRILHSPPNPADETL